MNDAGTQKVTRRFPTFSRFFGWLFSWCTIRRGLFVLACFVTLIGLYYSEENWRGARAWNRYRRELEARGARLDYRDFIPKPVPDEQNFAATPLVQSWFTGAKGGGAKVGKDDYERASGMIHDPKGMDGTRRRFVDLVAWERAFAAVRSGATQSHEIFFATNSTDFETRAQAASAVLEGLKAGEDGLEGLRAASRRPYSRYPVHYDLENPWGILIPHLARLKDAVQRLQLRACAELVAGRSESALEDVKLMLHLSDTVKEEPLLISYLVRVACLQITLQPVWEGLAEHRWSDTQLQEMQTRLQQHNFLSDLSLPLDGERAAGILTADLLYRKKYRPSDLFGQPDSTGGDFANFVSRILPHGWYALEQLQYCRMYEGQLEGTLDAAHKKVSPRTVRGNAHELEREIAGGRLGRTPNAVVHHRLLAAMLLPALGRVSLKAAEAQSACNQAELACALERFRLANGQYPENLSTLVPRFLERIPGDVISGEPPKYRRLDDGTFLLYSVGWNEKDDGGTPGKTRFDEQQGDWVWR